MFGLGFGEILVILAVALILLGPKRLPDAAKQLGKALRDFRRATQDLKDELEGELYKESSKPAVVAPAPPTPLDQPANASPEDPAGHE